MRDKLIIFFYTRRFLLARVKVLKCQICVVDLWALKRRMCVCVCVEMDCGTYDVTTTTITDEREIIGLWGTFEERKKKKKS